jgi:hypothetical protein
LEKGQSDGTRGSSVIEKGEGKREDKGGRERLDG